MKQIIQLMMKLIKSEIKEESRGTFSTPVSSAVLTSLYNISNTYDLSHIVGKALKENSLFEQDIETKELFSRNIFKAMFRYERTENEKNSVVALFEEERIPFVLLKGLVIRNYYPQPWMRTSSDIDVLVPEEDLQRAQDTIIKKLSYTYEKKGGHDVSLFSPSGVHLELHYALFGGGSLPKTDKPLKNVWSDATLKQNTNFQYELSQELFYYYHIAHMAKHFINGGCGIKPFVDLYLIEDNLSLDEERKRKLLKEGGLLSFSLHCQQLCDVWFEEEPHTDFTQRLENYVLYGGMYGNLSNRVAVQQNKKGGKFGYALSRIWLPYNVLKFHYPTLEKHKELLPLYEVRRWFKLLFFKVVKRSLNELKANQNVSPETAKETARLLEELGL